MTKMIKAPTAIPEEIDLCVCNEDISVVSLNLEENDSQVTGSRRLHHDSRNLGATNDNEIYCSKCNLHHFQNKCPCSDDDNESFDKISYVKHSSSDIDTSGFGDFGKEEANSDIDDDLGRASSRYILRSRNYTIYSKTSKGSLHTSSDGSPCRFGSDTAILGYLPKRCKECESISHEQGHHSIETVFPEDVLPKQIQTTRDLTVDSLVVFNVQTGDRLMPDGCEDQIVPKCEETCDDKKDQKVEANDKLSRRAKLKNTCTWIMKKLIIFSVSYVGLSCMVVCYAILGALIFQQLEAWHEKKSRAIMSEIRATRIDELRDIAPTLQHLSKETWAAKANDILKEFQTQIYKNTKELGWDGVNNVVERERDWTFTGALLYSVTVITTIGYGHITPKTSAGRVATMFYAFFGIPLTLLCIANLGNIMAQAFRILYYRMLFKLEIIYSYWKIRYSESRITGKFLPCHVSSPSNNDIELQDKSMAETDVEECKRNPKEKWRELRRRYKGLSALQKQQLAKDVPIWVCLVLVIGYSLVGSLLFGLWETNWGFMTGFYFCFITLSTIGLGDIVPGHSIEAWQNQEKQFICSIYLLVGMTMLAMSFGLMQKQLEYKSKRFAVKIGLLDDEEFPEEIMV